MSLLATSLATSLANTTTSNTSYLLEGVEEEVVEEEDYDAFFEFWVPGVFLTGEAKVGRN